jgi:hypothetical protein
MDVKHRTLQVKFGVKQSFVNRGLSYILKIWEPRTISNKDLWKATGKGYVNSEIRNRKFRWIGHTLKKEVGEIPCPSYNGTLSEAGRGKHRNIVGEGRVLKKEGEAGMN